MWMITTKREFLLMIHKWFIHATHICA